MRIIFLRECSSLSFIFISPLSILNRQLFLPFVIFLTKNPKIPKARNRKPSKQKDPDNTNEQIPNALALFQAIVVSWLKRSKDGCITWQKCESTTRRAILWALHRLNTIKKYQNHQAQTSKKSLEMNAFDKVAVLIICVILKGILG